MGGEVAVDEAVKEQKISRPLVEFLLTWLPEDGEEVTRLGSQCRGYGTNPGPSWIRSGWNGDKKSA